MAPEPETRSAAFFAVGFTNSPVPTKGGVLVPFPYASLFTRMTDANGGTVFLVHMVTLL